MADPILLATLSADEGNETHAYPDTQGVWTIGKGHIGPEVVPGLIWTQAQIDTQFEQDIDTACADLTTRFPWTSTLDPVRLRVLQNMCFNLGIAGLAKFVNTLAAVKAGDYTTAANGMLSSLWARQVRQRAVRLANQMKTGQQ